MKAELTAQILGMYVGRPCHLIDRQFEYPDYISFDAIPYWEDEGFTVVPHLRRLESITEEECREVYKIETDSNWSYGHECKEFWWDREYGWEDPMRLMIIGTPAAWLYLLSRGFDLFGLIDAGLAKEVEQ